MLSELAVTDQPAQAGPLGLFVVLLLAIATLLLIRSMSRHLRRIPRDFEPPAGGDAEPDEQRPHSGP